MFFNSRVRWKVKTVQKIRKEEDHRDSPRFEVPLYVRNSRGAYLERYGRLGISGFYFETDELPIVGQRIDVKFVLLGLGHEVETSAQVIAVSHSSGYHRVAARFENIPFSTERMIARWLDMLVMAHQVALAV
jgi:hypothetical protein